MCGIFGFQVRKGHKITQYENTLISYILASEMESRGRDSFGGVQLPTEEDESKTAKIVKGIGRVTENGTNLLNLAAHSRSFLGHTRAATKGAVIIPNCHPFTVGDVLGVHNGIIQNYDVLDKKYNRNCDVDSMHVFHHLNEGRSLKDLYGYGTFFWTKESEKFKNLYFARTMGGQLTLGNFYRDPKIEFNNTEEEPFLIAWASQDEPLKKIAKLLNLAFHPMTIESEIIHMISDDLIFKTKHEFKFGGYYDSRSSKSDDEIITPYGVNSDYFKRGGPQHNHKPLGQGCRIDLKGDKTTKKKLSRKEKKAFKKFQKGLASQSWTEDPTEENIYPANNLNFVFIPENGINGETRKHYLCFECNCILDTHMFGWCQNNGDPDSSCDAKVKDDACSVAYPVCVDCGHFLVEGVHEKAEQMYFSLLHCTVCDGICAPESMVLDADRARAEEIQQEKEIAASMKGDDEREVPDADLLPPNLDKPTEIVIKNLPKPTLLLPAVEEDRLSVILQEFSGIR